MAIFINEGQSNMFKSKGKIKEPNQDRVVVDRFSEFVKQQHKVNRQLTLSYNLLNQYYERQEQAQKHMANTLNDYEKRHDHHEAFKNEAIMELHKLNQKQTEVEDWMKQEKQAKADLMEELKSLHHSNQKVIDELKKQELEHEGMSDQLHEILSVQQKIAEQIDHHDDQQKRMVQYLENQEALIEKIARQMTNFRSILYERSHHLAEKIEDNYQLTSSYVHQLLTGKENPLRMVVHKKKDQE